MIVGYNRDEVGVQLVVWSSVLKVMAVLLVTFILTVFFDLVSFAIEFGGGLAAFLFLKRMSDVAQIRQWVDKENLDDQFCPRIATWNNKSLKTL